ncbi:hypothetical protein EBZ37_13500, partial [bacterium]|nr:hypothetical protein [bacterium]
MTSESLINLTTFIKSIKLTPYDNNLPATYVYKQLYDYVKALREQYTDVIVNPRYDKIDNSTEDNDVVTALDNLKLNSDNTLITNPRVIISRNKYSKLSTNNVIFNGIIIDAAESKVIAIHPKAMLLLHNDLTVINKEKYRMYKAYDGSLITVYYWNNKWCIASAKSIDFSDSCMFGKTTVNVIIKELLDKIGLSFDDLDKNTCYSFVFTHPEWHPRAKKSELRYINAYDVDTYKLLTDIPEILKDKINIQEEVDITNIDTLIAQLHDINKDTFISGYIFRAIDDNSIDYYIESAAMNILRKCIYAPSKNLRTFDQIALKNFLIGINNKALTALCPQFKDSFMIFDSRIDILITRIITKLYYPRGRYRISRLETTANYFLNKVSQLVHPNNTNARNIIYDIIVDHQYYD